MLDPLTALGLAANILQFVEVIWKAIQHGYEVYESANGMDRKTVKAWEPGNELSEIVGKLTEGKARTEDPGLRKLASNCLQTASEIRDVLNKSRAKDSHGAARLVESAKVALRTLMDAKQLQRLQRQLNEYRSQVNSRLIYLLWDEQTEVKKTLAALVETVQNTQAKIENRLSELQWALVEAADSRQDIPTLIEAITALQQHASRIATTNGILQSLHFNQIDERRSRIKENYGETFRWIFEEETSSFAHWASRRRDIFWLSGKAGSGKSTLMKFLVNHPETKRLLKNWAGENLIVASYYFWFRGTSMQKSQEGLLRTLLFQILRQCPEIIPIAVPSRWLENEIQQSCPDTWTKPELMQAIRAALSAPNVSTRFCFFIDGLDEFVGDHWALTRELDQLASLDTVKICVSSRPHNVFIKAFESPDRYKLVLEDLTQDDMDKFVRGMLEEDDRFQAFAEADDRAVELARMIRVRAQGVFLWVALAVSSLLRGLSDDDDFDTLVERLREIPSELHEFFQQILDSIEKIHLPMSARLLALAQHTVPLPLMSFFFLKFERDDQDYAIKSPIKALTDTQARDLLQTGTKRVNQWCRDLLVVYKAENPHYTDDDAPLHYQIDFLHKTVADFLVDPDVSAKLHRHVPETFCPPISICRILIAQAKLLATGERLGGSEHLVLFSRLALQILYHARTAEMQYSISCGDVLWEADRIGGHIMIMGEHRRHWTFKNESRSWTFACEKPRSAHRPHRAYCESAQVSFLGLAVSHNLLLFVREALECNPRATQSGGRALLDYAVYPSCQTHDRLPHEPIAQRRKLIELILQNGGSPNQGAEAAGQETVWVMFLLDCFAGRQMLKDEAWSIAKLFLKHGAEIDIQIPTGKTVLHPDSASTAGGRVHRTDFHLDAAEKDLYTPAREILATIAPSAAELEECLAATASSRVQSWGTWLLANLSRTSTGF